MLLLHGIASTAWSWAPVARRIHHRLRVLAPDLRGHGLSEGARSGLDLESMAWDALTVLAANGAGEEVDGPPAIIAGHGLGAMVAATAARLQPASVAGLALVDGGWEDLGVSTRMSPGEFLAGIGEPPEVLASMDAFLADRRDFDPDTWDADQERAAPSPGGPEARRPRGHGHASGDAARPGRDHVRVSARRHHRSERPPGCWSWWQGLAPRTTRWRANGSSPCGTSLDARRPPDCRRHGSCGCRGPATISCATGRAR